MYPEEAREPYPAQLRHAGRQPPGQEERQPSETVLPQGQGPQSVAEAQQPGVHPEQWYPEAHPEPRSAEATPERLRQEEPSAHLPTTEDRP